MGKSVKNSPFSSHDICTLLEDGLVQHKFTGGTDAWKGLGHSNIVDGQLLNYVGVYVSLLTLLRFLLIRDKMNYTGIREVSTVKLLAEGVRLLYTQAEDAAKSLSQQDGQRSGHSLDPQAVARMTVLQAATEDVIAETNKIISN